MVLLMHRKRVFPSGSSIDAELVEMPINWSSKSKSPKQNEVYHFYQQINIELTNQFQLNQRKL
ncbi:ubiquitin-conjugating enzyme, partial [Datura stramonium]|nr:ubiquitin-conjugating enzyme [Datura stramonium]